MALSTERKVFLGVFAVALGSLIVERGFLGGPSSAGAASVEPEDEPVGTGSSAAETAGMDPGIGSAVDAIRARLGGGGAPAFDGDATGLFFPEKRGADESDGWGADTASRSDAKPRLSAIMPLGGGDGSAILDGSMYHAGERLPNGDTLVRVVARRAVLERDGREYTLSLPVRR